jgi:hypothetical protein
MKYVIGTGYFSPPEETKQRSEVFKVWYNNTLKFSNPKKIYVINSNSSCNYLFGEWINLMDNPGHSLHFKRRSVYCGMMFSVLVSAMLAYGSDCDLIYKEQDCLCFGNWVDKLYEDGKGKQIVLGKYKTSEFKYEISLILLKKEFIPNFLSEIYGYYANIPGRGIITEKRFEILEKSFNDKIGIISFGYGRRRPININDKVFYVQHIGYELDDFNKMTPVMRNLKAKKMI